jgi:hypothetical protein
MCFNITNQAADTGRFVIVPHGASAPSDVQVYNGQDGSGSPVVTGFCGTVGLYPSPGEFIAPASNLIPDTDYDSYFDVYTGGLGSQGMIPGGPTLENFQTMAITTTPAPIAPGPGWNGRGWDRSKPKVFQMNPGSGSIAKFFRNPRDGEGVSEEQQYQG